MTRRRGSAGRLLYRCVLTCYPRAWCARYAAEQLRLFDQLAREERPPGSRAIAWTIRHVSRAIATGALLHADRARVRFRTATVRGRGRRVEWAAATRALSRPAGPPPTTSTSLGCCAGGLLSPFHSVSRETEGFTRQET